MQRICVLNRDRRGAAVVEVALVLPLFLLVVAGIVEFGRALMVGQLVTNGARFGARQCVVHGSTNTAVMTDVQTFTAEQIGVDASAVTVTIEVTPAPSNPDPGGDVSLAQSNDLIEVFVSVPYDDVAYIAGNFLSGFNLTGHCAMRHE